MYRIILSLALMFIFVISGCVTGSKVIKPSPAETGKSAPDIEQKNIAVPQSAVSSVPAEPVVVQTASVAEARPYAVKSKPKTAPKIQYSQIMNLIGEFIDMKESNAIAGENSYLGVSENKLTIFEIKGDKDNIKEASMKLIYPKGIDKTSVELNNAMMSRFLKNAAPEFQNWHSKIKGILYKFYSMETGAYGTAEEDIELSNKIIRILYNKNADCIVVTLKTQP